MSTCLDQICLSNSRTFPICAFAWRFSGRYQYLQRSVAIRWGYDLILGLYLLDRIHQKDFSVSGISISENNLKIDFDAFEYFEKIKIDARRSNPFAKILMRQDSLHPVFDVETRCSSF
jgi:hypothetical protein